MKLLNPTAAVAAAILLATLTIGANSGSTPQRPPNIPVERWIALGPNAGFALNANLGGSEAATEDRSNPQVVAELHVKTSNGWARARIDNPVHAIPLTR